MPKAFFFHSALFQSTLFALLLLVLGFALYGSAGHDDSHITFWASYSLREFGEILNYNGDRVEQSSSLLLTLLIALFSLVLRLDIVNAGYLVTILSGALCIYLTALLCQRFKPELTTLSLLFLVSSPAFLLWNFSGMESTLAAACLLGFIISWADLLSERKAPSASSMTVVHLATLCLLLVRPEMITFTTSLVFALFFWRRISNARGKLPILIFYASILLSICLVVLFRYLYFGQVFPQPVYAKVESTSIQKLTQSFYYFVISVSNNIAALIACLGGLAFFVRFFIPTTDKDSPNFYLLLTVFSVLAYSAFIFLSGGDWMQAARFFVPILPLCCVISAYTLNAIIKRPAGRYVAAICILVLNIKGNWVALKEQSHGTPIWTAYHISPQHKQQYSIFEQYNQEHLRDMDVIDTLDNTISTLLENQHEPVVLLSGQSGMVFFYTAKKHFGKVKFFDNRGLVESSLVKCSLVDDVERSNQGLYFSFDGFFARQPQLAKQCGVPEPDILYDINDMSRKLPQRMKAFSYTLTHNEGGKMLQNASSLPAKTLPSPNFVMIKEELAKQFNLPQQVKIRYQEKPLSYRALAPKTNKTNKAPIQ